MEFKQVKEAIGSTPKGANIIIEWTRKGKTRKGKGITDNITKSVHMVGRIGIEYDNIKNVKVGRTLGELPATNHGLPWGKFEIYPYLIEHNEQRYLRFYNGTSNKTKAKTQWFKNGEQVNIDEIKHLMVGSEDPENNKDKPTPDCFCIKIESITKLHSEIEIAVEQEKVEVEPVAEPVAEPELID